MNPLARALFVALIHGFATVVAAAQASVRSGSINAPSVPTPSPCVQKVADAGKSLTGLADEQRRVLSNLTDQRDRQLAASVLYATTATACCVAGSSGSIPVCTESALTATVATVIVGVAVANVAVTWGVGGAPLAAAMAGSAGPTLRPTADRCTAAAGASAAAASELLSRNPPAEVQRTLTATRDAIQAAVRAIDSCVQEVSTRAPGAGQTPPPPSRIGEGCSASKPCAVGLACTGGTCKQVGVPPSGSCDANRLCGPGLECRGGKCQLPCVCAAPCFTENGACRKNVVYTETVRENCARVQGVCVLPCFEDARHQCMIEREKAVTRKEDCGLTCP